MGWSGGCSSLLQSNPRWGWVAVEPPAGTQDIAVTSGGPPDMAVTSGGRLLILSSQGVVQASGGQWQTVLSMRGLLHLDVAPHDGWAITNRAVLHANE